MTHAIVLVSPLLFETSLYHSLNPEKYVYIKNAIHYISEVFKFYFPFYFTVIFP